MMLAARWMGSIVLGVLAAAGGLPRVAAQSTPAAPAAEFQYAVPPASNEYALGEDSKPQAGVPKGVVYEFKMEDSKVYPGTKQKISVYVPAEYVPEKPACVYVQLDGLSFHVATVFDNLIHQRAMPVTVAVGIESGSVGAADASGVSGASSAPGARRYQRSFEFDSMSGRFVRFVLEEVLPAVEQHAAPDGRKVRLSANADDRAIGGGSTGGIGAFTAAWERPDAFHRVFSSIGTYVGMRGGEQYYVEVRKTEPKPIRIFMEDGVHDEWPGGPEMGDWWMSNLTMQRALEFAGYDLKYRWGLGTHDGHHADLVFPEAMRWLWRDWPKPVVAMEPGNPRLQEIVLAGEGWQSVMTGCEGKVWIAAEADGEVYAVRRRGTGVAAIDRALKDSCNAIADDRPIAAGPDGRVYVAAEMLRGGVNVFAGDKKIASWLSGVMVRGIAVRQDGSLYVSGQRVEEHDDWADGIWLVNGRGEAVPVASGLKVAAGLAVSPDGAWLFAAQAEARRGLSYRVLADGKLDAGEPFYEAYQPQAADTNRAAGVVMDREGRAYLATAAGIEVFDHNGRVIAILPLPGNEAATGICFGGKDFSTLYVSAGGSVYARRMKVGGLVPGAAPVKMPDWGAGL